MLKSRPGRGLRIGIVLLQFLVEELGLDLYCRGRRCVVETTILAAQEQTDGIAACRPLTQIVQALDSRDLVLLCGCGKPYAPFLVNVPEAHDFMCANGHCMRIWYPERQKPLKGRGLSITWISSKVIKEFSHWNKRAKRS